MGQTVAAETPSPSPSSVALFHERAHGTPSLAPHASAAGRERPCRHTSAGLPLFRAAAALLPPAVPLGARLLLCSRRPVSFPLLSSQWRKHSDGLFW